MAHKKGSSRKGAKRGSSRKGSSRGHKHGHTRGSRHSGNARGARVVATLPTGARRKPDDFLYVKGNKVMAMPRPHGHRAAGRGSRRSRGSRGTR